jgi:methionyl-tRNA formyltransferase
MKIFVMVDNWVGWQICKYLIAKNEDEIVGLALHPEKNRKFGAEILEACQLQPGKVFACPKKIPSETIVEIEKLQPDIILSVFWAYILPPVLFNIPPRGCINFHCSYLPYNKGANPNVWPIIEGTKAGISLHYIDEGIDTGAVIAQHEIPVEITDTGGTLYKKLIQAFPVLFSSNWNLVKSNCIKVLPQPSDEGTFHYRKDFKKLDEIDLEKSYTGKELINLLRARTFEPHPSAYFYAQGRKVFVRVSLEYGE